MELEDYLAKPAVAGVLNDLVDACFGVLEEGGDEDDFPDATEFLKAREIEIPGSGTLHVRYTVEEKEIQPTELEPSRVPCPDGSDGCRPVNCKWIKGEYVCGWLCKCP